jgi:hypothetical protein
MAENITLQAGILTLVTEGHLSGEDANDSRMPHFPQNTFYLAPAPEGEGTHTTPNANGICSVVKKGKGTHYIIDNSPKRLALSSSTYPNTKTINGVQAILATSGGNSGVTIGVGIDLGAGGWSKAEIEDIFGAKLKLPAEMVQALTHSVGKIGIPAAHAMADYQMRALVRLTQQQVADLLHAKWQAYENKAKKGMPLSQAKLHPALLEVFSKICYGYGHVISVIADYDKPLSAISDPIEQAKFMVKMLQEARIVRKDRAPEPVGSADKFIKYIQKIQATLEAGGTVTVSKEATKITDLLNPANPTLDWAGEITGDKNMRKKVSAAAAEEPKKMQEAYAKLKNPPPLPNPNPNPQPHPPKPPPPQTHDNRSPKASAFLFKANRQLHCWK